MIKKKIIEMINSYKTQGFPKRDSIRKQIVFFHSSGFLTRHEKFALFNLLNE